MTAPIISTPKHQYSATCPCDTCTATFIAKLRASRALQYGYAERPRMRWRSILAALAFMLLATLLAGVIVFLAFSDQAHAREGAIHPVPAPNALLKARAACPNSATPVECRSALRRAYAAVEWQKHARWHAQALTVRQITLDAITWAAQKYGVSAAQMRTVGNCESHLWPFATNGQYAGWAQLSTRHRADPIFNVVPWQDAYATASHVARYVRDHGWGEWQCQPTGGLRW